MRTEEKTVHKSGETMDVQSNKKRRLSKSAIIAVVLLVMMCASLFSANSPEPTEKVAARADGDIFSWNGSYQCSDWWPFLPPCTVPRPVNPRVGVVCAKPQLTVALLIDRSDSVIRDTGGATPGLFKQSIELLLDDLFARFDPSNGELNFLLYAFGTKSVIQNDKDSNGKYITDASTPTALAAMKSTIGKIHFRNGETYTNKNQLVNGFQSNTSNPYDLERAYNAGSSSSAGVYGLTIWQDPLVEVLRAQSGAYNVDQPGKKIDLAVMFTDGIPDKSNGSDWNWAPGTYRGNDLTGYSWNEFKSPESVAQQYESRYNARDDLYRPGVESGVRNDTVGTVDALRSGLRQNLTGGGGSDFKQRPKVSVRGIMIHPNATQVIKDKANSWGNSVFSNGNYYFAQDFDAGLKSQITGMAKAVMEETGCQNLITPVYPSLVITPSSASITPQEGNPIGQTVDFKLTNNTNGPLDNVTVCIKYIPDGSPAGFDPPCLRTISYGTVLGKESPAENFREFNQAFTAELGSPKGTFVVSATGKSNAPPEALEGRPPIVQTGSNVASIPDRVSLPS